MSGAQAAFEWECNSYLVVQFNEMSVAQAAFERECNGSL